MLHYRLNPYISFVESHLFPDFVEYAVFHRLSGALFEPSDPVRALLGAAHLGHRISFTEEDLRRMGDAGNEILALIQSEFLIAEDFEPLTSVQNWHVARPMQNPAVVYQAKTGSWILVRTSMEHTIYSRTKGEMPAVIEEILSPLTAKLFLLADGSKTLQQVFWASEGTEDVDLWKDADFRNALDFLSSQERQVIKLTSQPEDDLRNPFSPVNIVPRNLYHSERWNEPLKTEPGKTIIDFHLQGIEDASWEFDLIEPTVNHGFRFSHPALGGLDYGSRFCVSALRNEVRPRLESLSQLNVLEVGGGTGSFARSFIQQAQRIRESGNGPNISYHILDLSPALIASQRKVLGELVPENQHFQQDATEFELPGLTFDLIISNEVIADFPVARVKRVGSDGGQFTGEGAAYLEQYNLSVADAPDSFLLNAGVFRFLERAWKHLKPGGALIVSEYGSEQHYPARSFQLNHDEYTIHFGHLKSCASEIGFECRLVTLQKFLELDDEVLVLDGREEHILCLNHVLKNYGVTLPFAVISKSEFERECQPIADRIGLTGYSFSPLKNGYYFGPNINDFLVLIMNRPAQ